MEALFYKNNSDNREYPKDLTPVTIPAETSGTFTTGTNQYQKVDVYCGFRPTYIQVILPFSNGDTTAIYDASISTTTSTWTIPMEHRTYTIDIGSVTGETGITDITDTGFKFRCNAPNTRNVNCTFVAQGEGDAFNIIFKANTDRAAATIELSYSDEIFNEANYCYLPELGYYYYMSEPVMSQQRIIYTLSDDLIMSFLNDVLELGCIISRQEEEDNYNAYLNDSRYPVLNKQEVTTQVFPYGFSDKNQEIIIAVNGGGGS